MFILILIVIGWIIYKNYEKEAKRKQELERERYWASPEGIKERKEQIEQGKKATIWLNNIEAVRSFIRGRKRWCWSCKSHINIKIDVEPPIYHNSEIEEKQFNQELNRIVCPRCNWVICENCKSCGCGYKY